MGVFNFNDEKSRKQIGVAIKHRNNTKTQNAQNLEAYHRKAGRLIDGRGEWEVAESIQTS